jgi:hypothetical protein
MRHIPEVLTIVIAAHGLALAIVNLTPTPKDDDALDTISRMGVKVYRAIELLAGVITPLVKR